MKTKFLIIALLLVTLFIASVNAPWATLSSGYAIWTDYHGIDIPPGTEVTATAGTTEHPDSSAHENFPDVTTVRFRWMPPGLPDFNSSLKTLTWNGTAYYNGWRVYTANDTQALDVFGDWGVQAWFYDSEGNLRNQTGVVKIRAVSVNVTPEIPVVGTAGAAAVMLLVLGLFWHIKKKRPINNSFLPT